MNRSLQNVPRAMWLKPREPFNLGHTLRFILSPPPLLNGRKFEPLLDYWVEGEYRRVAEIAGRPLLFGLSEGEQDGISGLRVRILVGPQDPATEAVVRTLVGRQIGLDFDLAPFYALARSDIVLSRLVRRFRGMRIPQSPTVYETLVSAILEQQVNLTFAHQVKNALIQSFGGSVEFEGVRYNAFPAPGALAIATPRQLRKLQVSGPKARYIIALSRAVLDGSLDLEGLRRVEPGIAYARLLKYKGVGPWTAQYLGLRALGHLDCLPASDVGLQKAVQQFYGLRKQPSPARVEKIARIWAGWRSYSTFYLWMTYWEDAAWREDLIRNLKSERRGLPQSTVGRRAAIIRASSRQAETAPNASRI